MALPPLHVVKVRRTRREAKGQVVLTIDPLSTSIGPSHTAAGQYVFAQTRADAKANPIALANPPQTSMLELLMKVGEENLVDTLALEGKEIEMSEAAGPGYPLAHAHGRDLLLVAVGSAIAPIRAAFLQSLAERKAFDAITVVYGVRDAEEFAFTEDLDAASNNDITIVKTVSSKEGSWPGNVGRVQAFLKQNVKKPEQTTAFVCGMGPMQNEVREKLVELGVDKDAVFFNY